MLGVKPNASRHGRTHRHKHDEEVQAVPAVPQVRAGPHHEARRHHAQQELYQKRNGEHQVRHLYRLQKRQTVVLLHLCNDKSRKRSGGQCWQGQTGCQKDVFKNARIKRVMGLSETKRELERQKWVHGGCGPFSWAQVLLPGSSIARIRADSATNANTTWEGSQTGRGGGITHESYSGSWPSLATWSYRVRERVRMVKR